MNDAEMWDAAVQAVTEEYLRLPAAPLDRLGRLLAEIKKAKESVHAWVDTLNGAEICASCGGECCATGKYHFTVVDLLAHLEEGVELFSPRFEAGQCPYLGEQGCLMPPRLRPYNCVTFNCERIDGLLEPLEREAAVALERQLRSLYEKMDSLFGNSFMHGIMINYERDLLRDRGRVLRIPGAPPLPEK